MIGQSTSFRHRPTNIVSLTEKKRITAEDALPGKLPCEVYSLNFHVTG